jgi:glycosyltransferase involved in cell wall biosynthesis
VKILHVNDNDLIGRRFSGNDLQMMLNKNGYDAKQFVVSRMGSDENTLDMLHMEGDFFLRDKIRELESELSITSLLYPFGERLARSEEFKQTDIVHYHLIFNHLMSLYSFRNLCNQKRTIWSLHDPWALTGHCVYPVDCKGWLSGCKSCPYLDRYAPLKEDNASSIWNIKKDIYKDIDVDIVVASEFMYDMVKRSPLTKCFKNIHLIPYGINVDVYKKRNNCEEIKGRLGIDKKNFVIMFRQDDQEWKGLVHIKDMLDHLESKNRITLLTVGKTGLMDNYKDKFQIIEYDWIYDENLLVDLYSVSNLFLMPSVAEAFGLMAAEAMACSLPVIVFDGTSLPKVTFSPKCGISLKRGDNRTFVDVVSRLISSKKERVERGQMGRQIVEKHYNVKQSNQKMISLYEEVYARDNKLNK